MGRDTRRLQEALRAESKREGRPDFDPGPIDGARGKRTNGALGAWSKWAHSQPQGIDVSKYQPRIHWGEVRAAGKEFVIVRASVSLSKDPLYATHMQGARAAGLFRMAYHFVTPHQDPKKQAVLFASCLAQHPGEGPAVADIESTTPPAKEGQPKPASISSQELIDRSGVFLAEVERLTGRAPLFYSYSAFIRQHNLAKVFRRYRLIVADYREGPATVPEDWPYLMHQYAGNGGRCPGVVDADGGPWPCDLDRFNGSLEELRAL